MHRLKVALILVLLMGWLPVTAFADTPTPTPTPTATPTVTPVSEMYIEVNGLTTGQHVVALEQGMTIGDAIIIRLLTALVILQGFGLLRDVIYGGYRQWSW